MELGWVRKTRDGVAAGIEAYPGLLQDHQAAVRATAAYVLADFREQADKSALHAYENYERSPHDRRFVDDHVKMVPAGGREVGPPFHKARILAQEHGRLDVIRGLVFDAKRGGRPVAYLHYAHGL